MSDAGTSTDQFTVGLIQMTCTPQVSVNLDKATALIERAAEQGAAKAMLGALQKAGDNG